MPANGTFATWMARLTGGLAAIAIVGGVGLAIGQSSMEERIRANTEELNDRRVLTEQVPVIQNDIEHMKQDMVQQHGRILDAISKLEDNLVRNGAVR